MKEQISTHHELNQDSTNISSAEITKLNTENQKSIDPKPKVKSKKLLMIIGLFLLIFSSVLGWRWWRVQMSFVSTDNAQIKGHLTPISARVSGVVAQVLVKDGDFVKVGQPLIILDTKDLELELAQAQANLQVAQAKLQMARETINLTQDTNNTQLQQAEDSLTSKQAIFQGTQTQIQQAQASVNQAFNKIRQSQASVKVNQAKVIQAQNTLHKVEADWQRYEYLFEQGAISTQQRDVASSALKDAQAQLLVAQEQVNQSQAEVRANQALLEQAQAQLKTAQAQAQQALAETKVSSSKISETQVAGQQVKIKQSQAKSDQAAVDQAKATLAIAQQKLQYTVIKAPVSGYVGFGTGLMTVEVGQQIQPQQPLLSLVPLESDQLYIEANFKETTLKSLKLGEKAEIESDAYPGEKFEAVVTGISPATGAQFALIPPDNATGNFNKVVQWIPVRLNLQKGVDSEHKLRAGLSVKVKVATENQ